MKKASETTSASQRRVIGKIIDDSGLPVPGTNISIKGENIGSICDVNGEYFISVTDGNSILVFSFIVKLLTNWALHENAFREKDSPSTPPSIV